MSEQTTTRRASRGRSGRRKKRNNVGLGGGIGTVIIIIVVIALKVYNRMESWQTLDTDTVSLAADESFTLEYDLPRSIKFQVEAKEQGGNALMVYWLDQKDYQALQQGTAQALQAVASMRQHAFVNEAASGQGTMTLPRGKVYIFLETVEDVPANISYTVQAFQ